MDGSGQLATIMMELIKEHEHLLRLGREKQQVLIQNDVQALQRLVQEELKHIQQVERLDAQRQWHIQQMLEQAGGFSKAALHGLGRATLAQETRDESAPVSATGVRLQDLLSQMPPSPDKERLEGLAQSLRRLLEELQHVNEQNRQLIEQSLAFVHYSMELFAASDGGSTMYDKQAKMRETPSGTGLSWLDQKI